MATKTGLYAPKPMAASRPEVRALAAPGRELPSGLSYRVEAVTGHGHGRHRAPVHPGRYVVLVDGESPWATARPEECLDTTDQGVWIADGAVQVCLSCGLDCT